MFNPLMSAWLRWLGGPPCFQVHGRPVPNRPVHRKRPRHRAAGSGEPLARLWLARHLHHLDGFGGRRRLGLCGGRAARKPFRPASRDHPVQVGGGRLRDAVRREAAGVDPYPSASEILGTS